MNDSSGALDGEGRTDPARILVVDDDARLAASIRRALVYEGHRVEVAGDGSSALAAARDRPAGLVVLDVMLPRSMVSTSVADSARRRPYPSRCSPPEMPLGTACPQRRLTAW